MLQFEKIANFLFRCWHRHLSLPLSLPRAPGAKGAPVCYVVCLDCGRKFNYDPKTMALGEPLKPDDLT